MTLWLGCIADDFTGATDVASMLVRAACARFRPSVSRRGDLRISRLTPLWWH